VLTHSIAIAIAGLTPFLVGVVVIKAPILPLIAMKITEGEKGKDSSSVIVGYLVASDDQMSTVLDREGHVRFIQNDRLGVRILCPDPGEVPRTSVSLHGWYVEQSVISWLAPALPVAPRESPDSACQGHLTESDLDSDSGPG
jgi:hypothetical protein